MGQRATRELGWTTDRTRAWASLSDLAYHFLNNPTEGAVSSSPRHPQVTDIAQSIQNTEDGVERTDPEASRKLKQEGGSSLRSASPHGFQAIQDCIARHCCRRVGEEKEREKRKKTAHANPEELPAHL